MSSQQTGSALITGAARRIGAAIAQELHDRGLNIWLHYRSSAESAVALAGALNARRPASAFPIQADLLKLESIEEMAAAVSDAGPLAVLVNNASAFYPTPIGEVGEPEWDELFGSNLKGPFFLTQALLPALRSANGAVVNLTDIHAMRPLKHHPVYSAAKAGLLMMTQALARELGPEVRVNGIAPGAILWPEEPVSAEQQQRILEKTALKRQGRPEDIAKAAAFLALDAPYVTGQVIAVDGGRSLNM